MSGLKRFTIDVVGVSGLLILLNPSIKYMLENYPLLFTVGVGIGYPWLMDRSLDIDVFIISRTLALGLFFLILLNVLGMGVRISPPTRYLFCFVFSLLPASAVVDPAVAKMKEKGTD